MNTEPDDIGADIAAAMKTLETAPDPSVVVVDPSTTAVKDPPSRDTSGKFVSSDPTKTPVPGQGGDPSADLDKGGQPNAAKQGSDPTAADPGNQGAQLDAGKSSIQLDPAKPPQGWRPEAKAKWETIPEDIRQEIVRREENSAQGVEKLRRQYEPMEKFHSQVIAPASQYLAHIGRDPTEYVQAMIMSEQTLTLGNPAQKMEKLLEIADTYGVPIRQALDSAMGGKLNDFIRQAHDHHKTPAQLPPDVQRELQEARAFREKMITDAATAEYNAFVADEANHPFFEDVKEDMAKLIESGACQNYQDAYETAVWRDPKMRQREQARLAGAQQADALRQRQIAAGEISTPNGVPLVVRSPEPGADESIEDTVRRAMAQQGGRA